MTRPLKILAVDDTPENLTLLEHFTKRQGYEIVKAGNGKEAIELYQSAQPDLILMDVMMPEMGGYEATREIRKRAGEQWIPIIFMSAMAGVEDQVEGLDAGGDDYVTKPVVLKVLRAKINAMQRIIEMREALATQAIELAQYRLAAEEEKQLANQLMTHMTRSGQQTDDLLHTWIAPAEHMNGDLLATYRGKDNRIYIMLADATGHGLLAALMQLPVSQAFYDMTAEGYSLSSIVTAINIRLRQLLPRDRFVAAILAMVDERNQLIEIWNGGLPDAIFVGADHRIIHRFPANAPALGVMPPEIFQPATQAHQWQTSGELVLYSDGAIDAANAAQELFGEERLHQVLEQAGDGSACDKIARALDGFLCGNRAQDDVSVVSVKCVAESG